MARPSMTHSSAAPPMRCVHGASHRRLNHAPPHLDRHGPCALWVYRRASSDRGLRPSDHDPKHHYRHRQGAPCELAGAAAAADSTDVPTAELVYRLAEG